MSFGKKRRKSSRFRGSHTHTRGFKKKARGSGHRGGFGMAGTGKRGDQRKPTVLNQHGNKYFGKDKALRKKIRVKLKPMNLGYLSENVGSFVKAGTAKETSKNEFTVDLKEYKILGDGEVSMKLKITAAAASKSAIDKVKKAGGDIIILNQRG